MDLANERRAVERERHESSPCAGDGERVQQRQHCSGVIMVDLNTSRVRHGSIPDHLAVATKENLTCPRLTAVEMAGPSYAATVGQIWRGGLIIAGLLVPVQGRFGRGDGVEYPWPELGCRLHLPPHWHNRDA